MISANGGLNQMRAGVSTLRCSWTLIPLLVSDVELHTRFDCAIYIYIYIYIYLFTDL